jgi:hypothetical protein
MWEYKFNSSDGPSAFDSCCVEDEVDIIELGYGVMFSTACENDDGPDFAQQIIKMRATRATELHWSKK